MVVVVGVVVVVDNIFHVRLRYCYCGVCEVVVVVVVKCGEVW